MTDDQRWLLEHRFLPLVDREKPDVILLAGDVYDRSLPPEEAVEVFDWITDEIVGVRRIPMIIISGNHDSAERLSVASRLLRSRGLYIFGPDDVFVRSFFPMRTEKLLSFPSPMQSLHGYGYC